MQKKDVLPLTILTGFLGAGKTTLLNHLLRGEHGMRIAVMVNDFGAVNIDAQMIVGIEGEEMVNLSNGCICCTIRGDLLRAAQALAARPDPPDYLLIEASGVSDPHAILMTFAASSARTTFRVDTVLTVVDVEQAVELHHAQQKLAGRVGDRLAGFLTSFFPSRQAQLYEHQISAADLVVLNKTDLLPSVDLSAVRAWVRKLSPQARLFETMYGQVPLPLVFGGQREVSEEVLSPHTSLDVHVHQARPEHEHAPHKHDHDHVHDHTLVFETWHFSSPQPLDLYMLSRLLRTLPNTIYRAKGVVYLTDYPTHRYHLQVVGKRVRLTEGEAWEIAPRQSQIVLIGSQGGVVADTLQTRFETALTPVPSPQGTKLPTSLFEWLRNP